MSSNVLVGDEGRYLMYAQNLCKGFYASNISEGTYLWNGPGYPIVLMPFAYLQLPLVAPKLFNAVLMYIALLFFFKTSSFFLNEKKSFFLTVLLGLYYPLFIKCLPLLLSEVLAFTLVVLFTYFFVRYINNSQKRNLWLSSFFLGFLILTKVLFFYVVVAVIVVLMLAMLFKATSRFSKKSLIVLSLSLLFISDHS